MCEVQYMPRVLNKYKDEIPADAVYIGRPSKWGNPFPLGEKGDREQVVELHRRMVLAFPKLQEAIKAELKGKTWFVSANRRSVTATSYYKLQTKNDNSNYCC